LRPIMMTSLAFILGVVPLMVSEGAGAEMRRTLGTAVFSGMLGVTLFGIFLTPVFYYVIQWFSDRRVLAVDPDLGDDDSGDHDGAPNGTPPGILVHAAETPGHGNGVAHAGSHVAH
jgi:multidrug efflux pump